MHEHKWICSDVPGEYICQCSMVKYYNRLTKGYTYGNA